MCVVFTIEASQQTPPAQLITSQHMSHMYWLPKWEDSVHSNALCSCRLSRFGSFLTYRRSQDFEVASWTVEMWTSKLWRNETSSMIITLGINSLSDGSRPLGCAQLIPGMILKDHFDSRIED